MHLVRAFAACSLILSALTASAQQRADAVLIVNSASARYADAQTRIRPYLDHFGVPYTVLDLATADVGPDIGSHALIVIGHAGLDTAGRYLSATEQANLSAAVYQGAGLVNFDYDLASNRVGRYAYVQDLFGFGYGWATDGEGVLFTAAAPGHFVSSRHASGELVWAKQMASSSIVSSPWGTVLARYLDSGDAFLVAAAHGQGRAVQFASYGWMAPSSRGPMAGLDDLVWRSLAWAARKPFVMQGLPPFLTVRVDDVIGPFTWLRTANDLRLKPWLGFFYQSMTDANAAEVATIVNAGNATGSVHALGNGFFYYDHANGRDLPDATMAANYQDATAWHARYGIPISRFVVPHFYEIGTNAFSGLDAWGVRSVATHMLPGQPYGSAWLNLGPYRLHDAGVSDGGAALAYADYLSIPNHPEYANRFFQCVTEIRDDAGYEWYPDATDVSGTIGRGTRQARRALDSMALATLFTHEPFIQSFTASDWRAALSGILSNLAPYAPVFVTMDEACEYLRAKHDTRISASVYDPVTQTLATDLSGRADVATQFMVFTEVGGTMVQTSSGVPPFTGATRVTQVLSGTVPTLSSIAVTPASVTLAAGATRQLAATGAYSDGTTRDLTSQVTWASSNGAVAAVSSSGLATALAAGSATLTATLGAVSGGASVTVTAPPSLSSIAVTPASVTLAAGATQQLAAAGTYSDGSTRDLTLQVAWASSAAGVVGVSAGGLATAVAAGSATVSATLGAVSGSATFAVTPPAPAPLAVTTSSLPGGTVGGAYAATLAATGGTPPYAWSISSGALPDGLGLSGASISGTPAAAGAFGFVLRVTDAAGGAATASLSISVLSTAGAVSLWPATAAPETPDRGADAAVELGVKFTADVTGVVQGIRFYKSALNTGTHVGSLWSANGTRLAWATFTNETASGWQEVLFATPVAIAAGTVYVASYHAGAGHYARDLNYFAGAGHDSAPLHAPSSGASGGNGVYGYGPAGTFPDGTALDANYWVDVIFGASGAPALSALAVTPASVTIAAGATVALAATGTYSDGTTRDLTAQASWTSSAAGVATVSAAGVATGVAAGAATVTAAIGAVSGAASLTVTAAPVTLAGVAVAASALPEGGATTGTVTLSGPAAASLAVALSASDAAVTVPASVTVPAGATSATFAVVAAAVPATTPVTLTATAGAAAATATVTVAALSVSVSPASVAGGAGATGAVTTSVALPAAVTFPLASSSASATVPASVTLGAGATSATFAVSTSPVASPTTATLSVTSGSVVLGASLAITPAAVTLSALAIGPAAVVEGDGTTGTVTLGAAAPAGGATVTLSASSTAATVPASITVPAGATSAAFGIGTSGVTAGTTVTVTATYGGASRTATVAVRAATLSLSPTTLGGGNASTATVRLSAAVTTATTFTLSTSNASVATAPASVTLAAGATAATFAVATAPVTATTSVTVTATHAGLPASATLSVRVIVPSALTLSPTSVAGGTSATGTVRLNYAAPAGGRLVTLTSSRTSAATVPPSITVPQGATSATFTITTYPQAAQTSARISASAGGTTRSATLTVTP